MSQSAPIVTYPVRRSPRLLGYLLLLVVAGLGVLLAWGIADAAPGMAAWASAWLLWLLCTTLALWFWWQSPHGNLAWDGYHWLWLPSAGPKISGSAQIHLHWQHSLWVRWQADNGSQAVWLWLEQHQDSTQWLDLRRALLAPPAPSPPPTSTP
jgi:hypothetical protein